MNPSATPLSSAAHREQQRLARQPRRPAQTSAPAAASSRGGSQSTILPQNSIATDPVVFSADVDFSRAKVHRKVVRESWYADDYEKDFDADAHRPSAARLARLAARDLEDGDAHIDAYEERMGKEYEQGKQIMAQETPENIAAFGGDMTPGGDYNRRFAQRITIPESAAGERVRRADALARGTHNVAAVERQMRKYGGQGDSPFDRLHAEINRRREERAERHEKLLAQTIEGAGGDKDTDNALDSDGCVRLTEQQKEQLKRDALSDTRPEEAYECSASDMAGMLPTNPFGKLPHKTSVGLLELAEVAAVYRTLQPLLMVDEPDKKHYNLLEIVTTLNMVGAKFCDINRVKSRARLGQVLDPAHYGHYLSFNKHVNSVCLEQGHEHYDEEKRCTTLIVMTFRIVRRDKAVNKQVAAVAQEAPPLAETDDGQNVADLVDRAGEAATKENAAERFGDADGAEENVDPDVDYEGGQDLNDPSTYYAYRLEVVFCEAVDVKHEDETRRGLDMSSVPVDEDSDSSSVSASYESSGSGESSDDDDDDDASIDMFGDSEARKSAMRKERARQNKCTVDADNTVCAQGAAKDEAEELERAIMPTGTLLVSHARAAKAVGKYKARTFMAWCNSTEKPAPLCFRSYRITA